MKKLLYTSFLISLFITPSIFAEVVPDIPAGTAEEYYNRGIQYRQEGNLDQAISDYTNAIRVNSKHAKSYYNRANAYSKQGKVSQAIADYNKAVEINPQYTEAYYNLGNAYEKQGNLSQAITSYTKAIETNSKYAAAYCNRGNIYQAQGNFQQALDDYNKAAEINPNFAGVYANRGNTYQAQGNSKQAIADYNKAIELNPAAAAFYANRGNIYQNQGNLQQAIADYNNAIDRNPNDSLSFYSRGLAYYGLEQYGKSLADYTTAVNQSPNKGAYDDFVKYFPEKRDSDTGNIRGAIVQIFDDKLNLAKKVAAPVAAAPAPADVIPAPVVASLPPSNGNQTNLIPEEDIKILINKWLKSWQAGNMETYRSCYASNFESKNMILDEWINYKTNVRNKSKNINIGIDNLKISVKGDNAKAVFTQSYSSSIIKDKGTKTLELKKTGDAWKIYREIM